MKLNKNSWHYRLASKYIFDDTSYWGDDNICDYTKSVIRGAFIAVVLTFVGSFLLAAPLGDFFAWVTFTMLYGYHGYPTNTGILILVYLSVIVILGIAFCVSYLTEKFITKNHDDSFIQVAYESWRKKFCHKIDWVE